MHLVEPWFAFYDDDFALFTVFRRLPWPVRGGGPPDIHKLSVVTSEDRNTKLWNKLVTDESYRLMVRNMWMILADGPPPSPADRAETQRTLDEQIARAATAVARLQARKVPVVFVRDPSAGGLLIHEREAVPRQTSWDPLLQRTGAGGIHFEDHPELQGFDLPEWSHMTEASAKRYTDALYHILERDHALPDGARW